MISAVGPASANSVDSIGAWFDASNVNDEASHASWSLPAQLLRKLQQLSKNDSRKLASAADEITRKLNDAARSSSDPRQRQVLMRFADKFEQARGPGEVSIIPASQPLDDTPPRTTSGDQTLGLSHQNFSPQGMTACGAYRRTMATAAEQSTSALFSQLCTIVDSVAQP